MNTKQKQITKEAVLLAATTLILAEGYTTALGVKLYLRHRGYKVYQADVSEALALVAQQQGWTEKDNGIFRLYSFPKLRLMWQ